MVGIDQRSEGESYTSMQYYLLDVLGSLKMSYKGLSEATTQAQHERRRLPGYTRHKHPKAGFNMVKMTSVRKILSRVSVETVPETVGLICDLASCRLCLPLNLSEEAIQPNIDYICQHILPSYPSLSNPPHTTSSGSTPSVSSILQDEPNNRSQVGETQKNMCRYMYPITEGLGDE